MNGRYKSKNTNNCDADLSTDWVDELFEALSHQRRRYTIKVLNQDQSMTVVDLTKEVAIREHDAPLSAISSENLKKVHTSLYHTHLPKLADSSIVDYNEADKRVTLASSQKTRQAEKHLELVTT